MSKAVIILIVVGVLAAVLVGVLFFTMRDTNIVGVTTYPDRNTVVLCCKTGSEFVNGDGKITVGEGEHLRLDHALKAGSFDLALYRGEDGLEPFRDVDMANLPAPDAATDGVCGVSGVAGTGTLDLEVAPGTYMLLFTIHDTVGTATVTAEK